MRKTVITAALAALIGATAYVGSAVVASEDAQACYRGFILDRRCHEM